MTTRQYQFEIVNCLGARTGFRGDGENLLEAFKDGMKNVNATYRPSGSGKATHTHGLAVRLKTGEWVRQELSEFENAKIGAVVIEDPDFA